MKNFLVVAAILAIFSVSGANAQTETPSTKVPGTLSEQATVDPGVGKKETEYVTEDTMGTKPKVWSDDTNMVAALVGFIVVVGGGLFFLKKKKG